MKSDVICPICNEIVGRVHGYEESYTLSKHIYDVHPSDFLAIARVKTLTDLVRKKYRIHTRDLYEYSIDDWPPHLEPQL